MTSDSRSIDPGDRHAGHDRSIYIVGDIHGQLERLAALLVRAKIVTEKGSWSAGTAQLWFMGDFMDRGPRGIEAIDFVIRLQAEARLAGGQVDSLLGNHDFLALAAKRFRGTFLLNHQRNGGDLTDLKRLSQAHMDWLSARPAMARISSVLLAHADTDAYLRYGRTVTQVNRSITSTIADPDPERWDELLADLSSRHAFDARAERGGVRLVTFLSTFGARRVVHGHTPICYVRNVNPEEITEPLIYADGRCVNVDGALYLGGRGFVYRITSPV